VEAKVDPQEIKQRFASAGWDLDDGFSGYLVIGCSGDSTLSIVAHGEVFETAEEPLFEILDHTQYLNHWVREIPIPSQAAQMLREHGEPPEEG
jgi:hypothetical protein